MLRVIEALVTLDGYLLALTKDGISAVDKVASPDDTQVKEDLR